MRTRPTYLNFSIVLALAVTMVGCVSSSAKGQRSSSWPDNVGTVLPAQPPPGPAEVQRPIPITPGAPVADDPSVSMITPPVLPAYPKSAEEISSPAVQSLMKQARTDRDAGRFDQASAALERAQRIEPRNYFVWSALARVYLDKKLYDNAESVAQKSNSLARGNVYAELENWKVISAARQAQGDAIGALQAQNKVDEIQRDLGGG